MYTILLHLKVLVSHKVIVQHNFYITKSKKKKKSS